MRSTLMLFALTLTPPRAAWAQATAVPADFEIRADGQSVELTSDLRRARYRDSTGAATPVRLGEITRYDFSSFRWFSRRLARGSRLRLVITCPNSIYLEKNYGAGGVVAEESGRDAHVTHVALYHDHTHPSYVEIPIAAAP